MGGAAGSRTHYTTERWFPPQTADRRYARDRACAIISRERRRGRWTRQFRISRWTAVRRWRQAGTYPPRRAGAALFADISGFTPLTEALARELGPQRGAEELTRQLDLIYSRDHRRGRPLWRQRDRLCRRRDHLLVRRRRRAAGGGLRAGNATGHAANWGADHAVGQRHHPRHQGGRGGRPGAPLRGRRSGGAAARRPGRRPDLSHGRRRTSGRERRGGRRRGGRGQPGRPADRAASGGEDARQRAALRGRGRADRPGRRRPLAAPGPWRIERRSGAALATGGSLRAAAGRPGAIPGRAAPGSGALPALCRSRL